LTRSEKRQEYKRRASLFSGRGVSSEKELLTSIAQKIEDKVPLTAYEKKVWEKRNEPKTKITSAGRKVLTAASEALRSEREEPVEIEGTFEFGPEDNVPQMARQEDTRFAKGVEVESPDLAADQIKALENNDVAEALALLSTDKSADRVHRAVAQRLAQLLDATDVEIRDKLTDSEGNPVLGQALASGKKIRFSRAGGLTQEILLHEGTHAAAERVLEAPESSLTPLQLAAKRELQALHAAVKRDPSITSTDAKASLSEFVAEVMSNRNLQQQLAKKPWRLSNALQAFKSVILRLLGVKDTQSMLGAAMKSVDAIFQPTSVQTFKSKGVRTQYSQKDIAALHDGSNSMRQFAENFPQYIKQKDRTPADADRIGGEYLTDMYLNAEDYVAPAEPERLDYKSNTIMSDGKVFDPDNLLHLVEATPTTFAALQAQEDLDLRKQEADTITQERLKALRGLLKLLGVDVTRVYARPKEEKLKAAEVSIKNDSYTLPEKALVAKAASKYGVQSTPEGRLKLVTIDANNRHPVAVVSKEAANAIIEELRAGKNLKTAFLDGMQRVADDNAKRNSTKNGWQKFKQAKGGSLKDLYTEKEIDAAFGETGYDNDAFANDTALIEQLIKDGLLPDRRTSENLIDVEKAAVELNAGAAGTSWCTGASVSTARSQIKEGDFYIYYDNGKPEVAIRMEGADNIGEIRGNTPEQWLTPKQQDIAFAFLKTNAFKGADNFLEETQRKNTLTRIFSGKEKLGDSLVFSNLIDEDNSELNRHAIKPLFSFYELDGYMSDLRPSPSAETRTNLSNIIDRVANKDMAAGYFPVHVYFTANDTEGETSYRGRAIENIKASDIVRAHTISVDRPSSFNKRFAVLTFDKLESINTIYAFGSAKFPALKYVNNISIANNPAKTVIELSDSTFVDDLRPMSSSAEVTIEGGYYVQVTPIATYNKKYSTLTATITAPYVKVLPPRKTLFMLKPPKIKLETPNKIDDAPPIEEIEAATEERLLFARSLPTAARVANQIIGKQPTIIDSIKKNLFGLSFRTQVIDALAPLEQIANTSMDALNGSQMMYYLRKYGMRNHMTAEAIETGVPQIKEITRADGQKEWVIEAVPGNNIKDAVKRLATKDVIKEAGSADAANRLFTLYLAAIRGERVGYDKLNFGRAAAQSELQQIERDLASSRLDPEDKTRLNARKTYLEKNLAGMPTEADFRAAKAEIEANDTLKKAFDEVRELYNGYNTDLLNFLVQAGAMNKDEAARLLRAKDYIPYYRMRGGNAELVIGGETPIRIGNLKDNPHLQELVGGEEPIFDFLTSSVQNTSMLLDMGLGNIARKNVAYELADVGLASKPTKVGKAGAPKGTLEFKLNGEDYFVRVDTDYIGVPSDLLVKGMAGIPTMLPQGLRLMGIPAQLLRRTVTAVPVFAAKQLFRDSLGAYMLSGSNAPPLLGAINQLRKASPLKARGITGGQTFTGTTEDMSRLLKEMQEGRPGWMKAFAKMEALAHKADAATRQSQYESYRAQGLSDMEAELMALESMNFSKRGLSPTMHMASMLVPFLNAQIQGLDVLYKALTGKMPFNDKLDIQRKLFTRGASMFALTLAYAAAMQDDDEYKNATPDQKYGNWFLRLPFLDEMAKEKVTLRVPIPFEVGYIFKALPEMLYNSMKSDQGAKEALDALNHILIQIIPGGSSMVPIELGGAKIPVPVPIPAAMKPIIEVGLGKSFFTGRDIESAREQQEVPGMRYRDQTSELAKYIGKSVNFSPIKIEALINGYTGGMGLLALQALSVPLPKADVAVPEKRWSELPLVGSMFQPADASNIIDGVYKDFQKVTQAKTTYDELLVKGENAKAQAFLKENLQLIMLNQMAGEYKKEMGDLAKSERIIRGSRLTEEEKRKLLDRIKAAKIQIATAVRTAVDRTTPQASRP
jgi:antitoxin component YwqK of YwqJK toxin-antitoxin module